MQRIFDGRALTSIANRPDVRPTLGGEGEIPLVPAVADPRNFTFTGNFEGGIICMPLYPGTYEAHTIAAHKSSARQVRSLALEVRDFMFRETDCEVWLTKVYDDNPGAAWLAKETGFSPIRHHAGTGYLKLDLDGWASACSTTLEQGRAFHMLLEGAKRANKSELPAHPEDDDHDRAVGAAIQMAKAGNVVKGVNFYNKWAIFAGYGQISLLSEQPVLIDVQDAIMGLRDGQMEVLQCR